MEYSFYKKIAKTFNTNKSRSIVLWGNIYDFFQHDKGYSNLVDYLKAKTNVKGIYQLVYELNGPIRMNKETRERIKALWEASYIGQSCKESLEDKLMSAVGRPAVALELLRQISMASRSVKGKTDHLLIIIESADMMIPAGGNFSSLNAEDRRCVCIAKDWFSESDFTTGKDSVILLCESISEINSSVSNLPQMAHVEVPSPSLEDRMAYIHHCTDNKSKSMNDETALLASKTAGLTLQSVRQILCDEYNDDIIHHEVERFIKSQVGEGVVEFKKPSHTLKDILGNSRLKNFLKTEVIPRFRSTGPDSLSGAAVGGPIGSGKSFIFEAVANEIGCPVIVLKNLRSQYFGQTDVIFERLRRVIESLGKVLIFVDEADTQFGRVSKNAHETEKRLTGKIQAMMSDPKLKNKVIWLLMTARIHLLSPDIRRPGRVGSMIIPVLDPTDPSDKLEFASWCISGLDIEDLPHFKEFKKSDRLRIKAEHLVKIVEDYSAADWANLKSILAAKKPTKLEDITKITKDIISPNIKQERRYQTLQALVNCTNKNLVPSKFADNLSNSRPRWIEEIRALEALGYN